MSISKDHIHTGFIGDVSESQQACLDRASQYLKAKNQYKPNFDEWKVLKFCRGSKFDYEKVTKMLDEHIKFREKYNFNDIMTNDYTYIDKTRWRFQETIGTVDKGGRPVAIMKKGLEKFNISFYEGITIEDMVHHDLAQLEFYEKAIFPWCSQATGKRVDQSIQIGDVNGVGFGEMADLMRNGKMKEMLKTIALIRNENYPELQKEYIIINAPWWFRTIWSLIRLTIDKKSKKFITVLGTNYKKHLLERIDVDKLPDFLGGTMNEYRDEVRVFLNGPWSDYCDYCMESGTFDHFKQNDEEVIHDPF